MSENGNIGENSVYNEPNTGLFKEGNPGKPKGARHITTLVREALLKVATTKDGKKIQYEQAFIEAILNKAIFEQDPGMIRLMWNYLDGMPTTNINLNNMDDLRKDYFKKLDAITNQNNSGDSADNLPK